jgi:hypothetical protein
LRYRASGEASRAYFRRVLHHQAARHRPGTVHQSDDHRVVWWAFVGDSQRRTWRDISFHAADQGKSLFAFSRLTYAHCQCEHHRRAPETTQRDCSENLLSATPGAYAPSPGASGAAPGLNMSNPASDQIIVVVRGDRLVTAKATRQSKAYLATTVVLRSVWAAISVPQQRDLNPRPPGDRQVR